MKDFNRLFSVFATPLKNAPWGTIPINPKLYTKGFCFYWAYVFAKSFNGQCITLANLDENGEMKCESPHMIVKIGNLFFDGEYYLGTSHIPHKKVFHQITYHRSPEAALKFWNQEGYKNQFAMVASKIRQHVDNLSQKPPLWKQAMEPWKKY